MGGLEYFIRHREEKEKAACEGQRGRLVMLPDGNAMQGNFESGLSGGRRQGGRTEMNATVRIFLRNLWIVSFLAAVFYIGFRIGLGVTF